MKIINKLLLILLLICSYNHLYNCILTKKEVNKLYQINKIKYNENNCSLIQLEKILQNSELYHKEILFTTPCLSQDSFGNSLSDYIESRICANITGLHFISLFSPTLLPISQPKLPLSTLSTLSTTNKSNIMISYFPEVIYHPNQNINGLETAKKICTCYSICHENPYALLQSEVHMVRDILRPIVLEYYENIILNTKRPEISTIFWKSVLKSSSKENLKKLPEIPDVSIHYRCGDNLVGHYGFLSFPAFLNHIPSTVSTIYILSESSSRKSNPRRVERCNSILTALLNYLSSHYTQTSIGVIRGANLFDDFTRLALSKIVICSVSTFCYYAGMASVNQVYFPVTRLFAKATTPFYLPNIHWLTQYPNETVLIGDQIQHQPDHTVIHMLQHPTGRSQSPPPYIDLKKKPIQKYTSD